MAFHSASQTSPNEPASSTRSRVTSSAAMCQSSAIVSSDFCVDSSRCSFSSALNLSLPKMYPNRLHMTTVMMMNNIPPRMERKIIRTMGSAQLGESRCHTSQSQLISTPYTVHTPWWLQALSAHMVQLEADVHGPAPGVLVWPGQRLAHVVDPLRPLLATEEKVPTAHG